MTIQLHLYLMELPSSTASSFSISKDCQKNLWSYAKIILSLPYIQVLFSVTIVDITKVYYFQGVDMS